MTMPDLLSSTLPPTPGDDLTGRRLGDFHILRRLGSGGMADVYLAEQATLRRKVALKALKKHLAGDESFVRRFINEAQSAAALTHANIVQIHEVGRDDEVHYIAQEYVAGRNVKQHIDRVGQLSPELTVSILRQVAAALGKASEQKIIHRDIKPENILLSVDGVAKVADFGLARMEASNRNDLTQVGVTMGTPLYMSPEQVEGKNLDARSDLYSLGVTCYHMLAGEPPFVGETALSIALQHLREEPAPLENLRDDIPAPLLQIVQRLMSKDRSKRFQSPAELLKELRQLDVAGADDWPTEAADWSTSELISAAGRLDATQQLGNAMQTIALQTQRRRRFAFIAIAGMLLFVFVGAFAAWATRPRSLLAEIKTNPPPIEPQESARDQYLWATLVPSEQAYKSVAELFPPAKDASNQYYTLRAQQRLVELYLDRGDFQDAYETSRKIAASADGEAAFESFAIAGQAIALHEMKKTEQARTVLADLIPLFDSLEETDLRRRLMLVTKTYGIEFKSG